MAIAPKFREFMDGAVAAEFDQLAKSIRKFLAVAHNEDGTIIGASIATAVSTEIGLPIGLVLPYGGTAAPTGFLMCDGSEISRSTYADLFTVIGTAYGIGDGATTFNIPDLQGRFPLGKAASGTGSTLGVSGGSLDHTHTGPSHTHTIATGGNVSNTGTPSATTEVQSGTGVTVASDDHVHVGDPHDHGGSTGAAGAGNTGTANPAFQVVNYIILYT